MDEIKDFAPVIIPTLNRYSHLKRLVESLRRCTYADRTELIIGLDYPPSETYFDGYQKIKEYLPSIRGFKKVTVLTTDVNLGANNNGDRLVDYAKEQGYNAMIFSEDDNEFSPCFLDYMNLMLNHYKDDSRVVTVSGYIPKEFSNPNTQGVLFSYETNAWGFGVWSEKTGTEKERRVTAVSVLQSLPRAWKSFRTYPACFRMLISMVSQGKTWGDVIRTQNNIVNGTFQVRPAMSLVRNWGNDGSGENCKVDKSIEQQPISEALTFE